MSKVEKHELQREEKDTFNDEIKRKDKVSSFSTLFGVHFPEASYPSLKSTQEATRKNACA